MDGHVAAEGHRGPDNRHDAPSGSSKRRVKSRDEQLGGNYEVSDVLLIQERVSYLQVGALSSG